MSFNPMDLITGGVASKDEDKKAKEYLEKAAGAYDGITPPTLDPITLKQYSWLGDLTPEQISAGANVQYHGTNAHLADAATSGPSNMEGVSTDPRLADDQMASLAALKELAANGGMNAKDEANLNRVQNQAATADRGRREAILQNMAARGQGGGGSELLAQLQSNQAATDRQSQQGLDIAGMAQQRALDAMMQGGQLAGNIRGQDFGEKSARAAAMDAVARFNAGQQTSANQFNATAQSGNDQFNAGNQLRTDISNRDTNIGVDRTNAGLRTDAKVYNANGHQNISNANVDTTNKNTAYNAALPQKGFDNTMTVANGKAGAAKLGVDYYGKAAGKKQDAFGGMMGGLGKVAVSAGAGKAIGGMFAGGGGAAAGAGGDMAGDSDGADLFGDAGEDLTSSGAEDFAEEGVESGGYWHGGIIPGKARVPGDSPKNDTVRNVPLSPGEMVLPRSVTNNLLREISTHAGGDATKNSRADDPFDIEAFLSALTGKKTKGSKAPGGHDPQLAALMRMAGKKED